MAGTMNPSTQLQFMYLFERVGEPLYFGPRGDKNTYYNVPIDNLDSKTQHAAAEYRRNMVGTGSTISVKTPTRLPNLDTLGKACPKNALFSYFIPAHRNAAMELRRILMAQSSMEDFMAMSCVCRDSENINPRLWIYAFASSALQRADLKGFRMPAFWEVAPDQFVSPAAVRMAQRQAVLPEADRSIIVIERNATGDDSNPENRLAYFREDLGVNSHHWHWHLIYPTTAPAGLRDRKGELFYYMHHAIIARYDAERLGQGLTRVRRLDLSEPVPEGYFPKLYNTNSGLIWGSRQEGTTLSNVDRLADPRAPIQLNLEDIQKWRNRIQEAIDTGVVIGPNGNIPLTVDRGIDILGDIVESSDLNPNRALYGDFHNMGHVALCFSHDPQFRHKENMGVMGDVTTAMRDPVFYRWHKFIDDVFDSYKSGLTPYTALELTWAGIQVTDVFVQTPNRERNILTTNWMQSDIDLSRGLDFGRTNMNNLGPIWARVTHLNHEAFTYNITVQNAGREAVDGTVRIFMAPRLNEQRNRFDMFQQRPLFFEMDKFSVTLRPGANTLERASSVASVAIPWEQSFRDLERSVEAPTASQAVCGCGWPQHLLLPKGNASGQLFDLYVIVTNGALDRVARRNARTEGQRQGCRESISFCGLLDELYPDARAMGYPFDRSPRVGANNRPVATLDVFVQDVPNSRNTQVRIVHRDVVIVRSNGAPSGMSTMNVGTPPPSPTPSRPSSPAPAPTSRPSSPTSQQQRGRPQARPQTTTQGRPQTTPQGRPQSTPQGRPITTGRPGSGRSPPSGPTGNTTTPWWNRPQNMSSDGSNWQDDQSPSWGRGRRPSQSPSPPPGWTNVPRGGGGGWGG